MEENKNIPDYAKASSGKDPEQPAENIPGVEQSEIPPSGGESITSPEIFLPETEEQPLTESNDNMEVHHHSHAGHGKKNWRSYFWEFLMLFLAVFCGFLAEYQLEHKIERDRAKELAASFYNELKADSAALTTVKSFRERKLGALKYLQSYFQDSSITNCSNTFTIQMMYGFFTFSPSFFEPGDAILEQLKNSGSLRYFKSSELQKLTGDLSTAIVNLRKRNYFEEVYYRDNIWPFILKHADMKWYDSIASKSQQFIVTFLKEYEKTGGDIQFHFDQPTNFDRKGATNLAGIYKIILKGTGDSQFRIYDSLNTKLQHALRDEYHLK